MSLCQGETNAIRYSYVSYDMIVNLCANKKAEDEYVLQECVTNS